MYKIIHKNTGVIMDERETLESARLALMQCEAYDSFFKVFAKDSYSIQEREGTAEEKKIFLSIIDKLKETGIVGECYNAKAAIDVLGECVMSSPLQRVFFLYEKEIEKQLTSTK